jgi:Protein of unknown function (DUF3300)
MLFAGLFALLLSGQVPEMVIPEGTILPVILNETLKTSKLQDNDPILFSLAEDVRTAGHRGPVLLPRGSSVVGRVVMSERAGHFFGRSHLDIRVQEIITPTGESYDGVSSKIIDFAKKKGLKGEVKADGGIQGPVHRQRDAFFLLFPPTTLFQLLATPKRGPDIVLPVESRLYVKLMSPIYVETAPKVSAVTQLAPPLAPTPVPVPAATPFIPVQFPRLAPQAPVPVSSDALEVLVAPVALYPDAILRDLFRATTHPFEIAQANQWVHQPRDAAGSLPPGGYNESWDSSVKALTAYPELLQRMTADADWMMKLGVTYTAQPIDVLSAVQRQRMQAKSLRGPANLTVVASGRY